MPTTDLLARVGGPWLVARELGAIADESGRAAQTLPSAILSSNRGGSPVSMLDMNGDDNVLNDVRQIASKKLR